MFVKDLTFDLCITPAIGRKIRRKNATHAKAKKSGSAKIRTKFETLRREIKADIRKQHDLYVNNLVGDVKANPKDFYRYINSQKKDAQGIPPLKKRNGSGVAQSESEKAAAFNGKFTEVFTKSEHSQVSLLERSAPLMEDFVVTKEGAMFLYCKSWDLEVNPSKTKSPFFVIGRLYMFQIFCITVKNYLLMIALFILVLLFHIMDVSLVIIRGFLTKLEKLCFLF